MSLLTAEGPHRRAEPHMGLQVAGIKEAFPVNISAWPLWTQPRPHQVLPTTSPPQSGIVEVWQVRARDNKACD